MFAIAKRVCHYPLYLPPDCKTVRRLFGEAGDTAGGIQQLIRLARLGSSGAKSALAFVVLNGALGATTDALQIARQLCEPVAKAGDSYAQYVMGWVLFTERHTMAKAMDWWIASSKNGFAPAWIDIGQVLAGRFRGPIRKNDAIFAYGKAASLGHFYVGAYKLALLNDVGAAGRMLNVIAFPWVFARIQITEAIAPYSLGTFVYYSQRRFPFFRDERGARDALRLGLESTGVTNRPDSTA
jgi:hypothetical protein